jgi:hypothetical protein
MEMTIEDYNQNIEALQTDVMQLVNDHIESVAPELLVHEVTTIIARYFAHVLTLKEKERED